MTRATHIPYVRASNQVEIEFEHLTKRTSISIYVWFGLSTMASPAPSISAFSFDMLQHAKELETTLVEMGPYGPLLLFMVYLVSTVFMLPLWGFHMIAAFVYGSFYSALFISITQAICAGAAFSVSRYLVGPYIRGFLQRKYGKKFTAIDAAVGDDGFRIVLLLRLSPIIPFGVNNYICGCTQMKLWEFVLGTWLGVLPGTSVYCHMGAMGKNVMEKGATIEQKIVMGIGFVAALAVIKLLSDLSTKALKEAGIDDEEGADNSKKDEPSENNKKDD